MSILSQLTILTDVTKPKGSGEDAVFERRKSLINWFETQKTIAADPQQKPVKVAGRDVRKGWFVIPGRGFGLSPIHGVRVVVDPKSKKPITFGFGSMADLPGLMDQLIAATNDGELDTYIAATYPARVKR